MTSSQAGSGGGVTCGQFEGDKNGMNNLIIRCYEKLNDYKHVKLFKNSGNDLV